MNKKFIVTTSLLIILCFSLAGQTLAQTGISGVKGGDYFTFSIVTHWNTTNSSRTVPEYLVESNNTKWFNVSVSYVGGADVTAINSWAFNNGTEDNSFVQMEVNNGTLYYFIPGLPAFQGFFPANLNVGDPIRPLSESGLFVNETISWDYASGKRDTNVVEFSYEVTDFYNTSIGTETITLYIDKSTGVLVKRVDYTEFPDQTGSLEWELIETNVWAVSSRPITLLEIMTIITIVSIIVIVIILYVRSRRRH